MDVKFQVSAAVRTAINTHVPEILRDAGPKVAFLLNSTLRLPTDLYFLGKTRVGNLQAHEGPPWKIR
jgi:hypothetical protein